MSVIIINIVTVIIVGIISDCHKQSLKDKFLANLRSCMGRIAVYRTYTHKNKLDIFSRLKRALVTALLHRVQKKVVYFVL